LRFHAPYTTHRRAKRVMVSPHIGQFETDWRDVWVLQGFTNRGHPVQERNPVPTIRYAASGHDSNLRATAVHFGVVVNDYDPH
jgi:hypothetical protein